MSRYQILPMPKFFERAIWEQQLFDDDMTDEQAKELAVKELEKDKFIQIQPVFYRDGWYYDRQEKKCWYEWNNTAWKADAKQFQYELSQENARILSKPELDAIDVILTYGPYPKELKKILHEMLWDHSNLVMLRTIWRNSCMARKRILGK